VEFPRRGNRHVQSQEGKIEEERSVVRKRGQVQLAGTARDQPSAGARLRTDQT